MSTNVDMSGLSAFIEGHSLLAGIRARHSGRDRIYLVGGAIRDGLIGTPIIDIDLVTEGEAADLALALSEDALIHSRFKTAEVMVDGTRIDIATARRETYAHPGALPEVEAATLLEDLARRDFTINAMAVEIDEPDVLIDPHGGAADLERGVLRALHPGSFTDDPTRALRAARYAARFEFDLEPGTAEQLDLVDLGSVSRERVEYEFDRMASEVTGISAFRLLAAWGLVDLSAERLTLAADAVEMLESDAWRGRVDRKQATIEALFGDPAGIPAALPGSPYLAVQAASGFKMPELLVARVAGTSWLDRYVDEWSAVRPAITGDDLVLAGLPQGPAIGVGLEAALKARLDDGVEAIEDELAIAVAAAERALTEGGSP